MISHIFLSNLAVSNNAKQFTTNYSNLANDANNLCRKDRNYLSNSNQFEKFEVTIFELFAKAN